ncbi:MAG: hypothetical protein R2755_05645 [Acidimicrobiales bacterium]
MGVASRRERIIDEVEAAGWVTSGMTIAIGEPAPMAVIRQLIRRGVRDLTVVGSGLASTCSSPPAACAARWRTTWAAASAGRWRRRSGGRPSGARSRCGSARRAS